MIHVGSETLGVDLRQMQGAFHTLAGEVEDNEWASFAVDSIEEGLDKIKTLTDDLRYKQLSEDERDEKLHKIWDIANNLGGLL